MSAESSHLRRVWTMAGGGPARSGRFTGRVHLLARRPVRKLTVSGAVQASPVFERTGHAYVADMSGTVHAFDPSGKPLWRRQLHGSISATPALDPVLKRLFVATHSGSVFCLFVTDGTVIWSTPIPSSTDPRIVSDLLLVPKARLLVTSSWSGQFVGFDPESGEAKLAWDAGISPQAGASADADGTVYFQRAVTGQGIICGSVTADKAERALYKHPEGKRGAARAVVAAAPVIDEQRGVVYFVVNTDATSTVAAFSLHERRVVWTYQIGKMVVATPALRLDGTLLIAAMDGRLYGINYDGKQAFAYSSGAEYLLAGPVCELGGDSFLADPLGRLHLIGRGGIGQVAFEAPRAFQARPAFDPFGNLYAPCTDHTVYVFKNISAY